MTERQQDQAFVEQLRAENLTRATHPLYAAEIRSIEAAFAVVDMLRPAHQSQDPSGG